VRHRARPKRLGLRTALSCTACGHRLNSSRSAKPRAGTPGAEEVAAAAAVSSRGRCGRPAQAPSCPVPGTPRSGGRLSPGTSRPCLLTWCPPVAVSGSSSAPTLKVSFWLGFVCPSIHPSVSPRGGSPRPCRCPARCTLRPLRSLVPAKAATALGAWEFNSNHFYSSRVRSPGDFS
jgi:hypothetical protein